MYYLLEVLKKYAVFSGRARRKEYWMFILFNLPIAFVLGLIDGITKTKILGPIYFLAIFMPILAVSVRRLHDTDRSGWWLLVGFIPFIGQIIIIIFMAQNGQTGENQYGSDQKEIKIS